MIEILFENNNLLICKKPVGISSQGNHENDLPVLLTQQINAPVYPVSRLDQMVGGCIVFAKKKDVATKLQNTSYHKQYLAVITGTLEEKSAVLLDFLYHDASRNKSFVVKKKRNGVKEAKLSYEVLKETENMSFISVQLFTGRTHQIRVQFASRKHPLVGDGKYGSKDNHCEVALWAPAVSLKDPKTNEEISVICPPPAEYPFLLFTE